LLAIAIVYTVVSSEKVEQGESRMMSTITTPHHDHP